MRKKYILIIASVLLLAGISFGVFKVLSDKKIENNENNSNNKNPSGDANNNNTNEEYSYKYDEENKQLVFYKGEVIVKKIDYDKIDDSFSAIRYAAEQYPEYSGKFILYSGYTRIDDKNSYYKKILLVDLEKDIYKEFENIDYILRLDDDESNLIKDIVLTNLDGESAIIDLDGNYVKEFTKKKFKLEAYEGYVLMDYSYEDNIIVTNIDGKYGLEKITGNDVIIPHEYEDLQIDDDGVYRNHELYSNKYVKVKENGKWYLYDLNKKEKITKVGYDRLYLLDENVMFVLEDKYFSFKDYDDNLIIEDKILVENLFSWLPKRPEGLLILKDTTDNSVYEISICDGVDFENHKSYSYLFDLNNKTLKNITNQ